MLFGDCVLKQTAPESNNLVSLPGQWQHLQPGVRTAVWGHLSAALSVLLSKHTREQQEPSMSGGGEEV